MVSKSIKFRRAEHVEGRSAFKLLTAKFADRDLYKGLGVDGWRILE